MGIGIWTWVEFLQSGDPETRCRGAAELAGYPYATDLMTTIVPALIEALEPLGDDDYAEVHDEAVKSLARLCLATDGEVERALVKTLEDQRNWVRIGAMEALGRSGSRYAVDRITPFLKSESLEDRIFAAEALGSIGGERAVQALVAFESAERARVRDGVPPDALNAAVDGLVRQGHYAYSESVPPQGPLSERIEKPVEAKKPAAGMSPFSHLKAKLNVLLDRLVASSGPEPKPVPKLEIASDWEDDEVLFASTIWDDACTCARLNGRGPQIGVRIEMPGAFEGMDPRLVRGDWSDPNAWVQMAVRQYRSERE